MKKPKEHTAYCFLTTPSGDRITTPDGDYQIVPCEATDPPTEPIPVPPGGVLDCLLTRLDAVNALVAALEDAIDYAIAAPEGLDEFVCTASVADCACPEEAGQLPSG